MRLAAYLGTTGLSDVTYQFFDESEASLGAASGTGVAEQPASSGWYSADVSVPALARSVRWVSTGTTTANAREYFSTLGNVAPNTTTPPTAAANASAVRAELTTELGRIDATVNSRLAASAYTAPPAAADNAAAVRTNLATELGRIDVATGSRLAAAAYTTPPTAAANASAVRTELTTELGRVDAAISSRSTLTAQNVWEYATRTLSSFGTLASDIWSAATRTLTAFGFAVSTSGNGPRAVTITVQDSGSNPINGAVVRITQGVDVFSAVTNSSGVASFSLHDGAIVIAVAKGGFLHTPQSVTVSAGNTAFTSTLTAQTIPNAPADNTLGTVYGYLETPENAPAAEVELVFKLVATGDDAGIKSNKIISGRTATAITDEDGFFEIDLQRNDLLAPAGTQWNVKCRVAKLDENFSLTAATFDLGTIIT